MPATVPRLRMLIKVLDLGVVIPAALGANIGLLRGNPTRIKLAYALTGFLACLTSSVAGMAAVTLWKDDSSASPAMRVIALAAALGLGDVTTQLIRSYGTRSPHEEQSFTSSGLPHADCVVSRSCPIPAQSPKMCFSTPRIYPGAAQVGAAAGGSRR